MTKKKKRKNMSDSWELLTKFSNEESKKFIHSVIDSLCQKEGPRFDQFAPKLSLPEYARLKSAVSVAVKQVAREGLDRKKLSEVASQTAGISNEVAVLLAECIWVRREEVRAQLVREASSVSQCNLKDFDWDAKVALSSDKLGSLQVSLLSLNLHINEEAGKRKTENIELSLEELRQLVSALDSANKVVLQLRT